MSAVSANTIVRQLSNIKGVVGAAIFQDDKVKACQVIDIIGEETITSSAGSIAGLQSCLSMTGAKVQRVNLLTRDFAINILPTGGYTVLVFAEKNTNPAIINLTLKSTREKFESGAVTFDEAPAQAAAPAAAPAAAAPASQPPGELFNSQLDDLLAAIQGVLGPMGQMVFDDAQELAAAAPGDDKAKLDKLVKALAAEIPDAGAKAEFVKNHQVS